MSVVFNGVAANNFDMGTSRNYLRNVSGATLMAWVTYGALGTARTVIGVSIGTGTGTRAKFSSTTADGVDFRVRALDADTSSVFSTAGGILTTSGRFHIACVVNYLTRIGIIYINGAASASGTFATITAGNTSNTAAQTGTIGASEPGTANPWLGQIEDARVYGRVMGDSEIKTIYTGQGVDGINIGLEGRWMMNEKPPGQNADRVADLSPNGYDLVVSGTLAYAVGVTTARRRNRNLRR
jgi:hypothetical protein